MSSSSSSSQPSQQQHLQSQQRGLRALKIVTFLVVCITCNEYLQFSRTLQLAKSQPNSSKKNGSSNTNHNYDKDKDKRDLLLVLPQNNNGTTTGNVAVVVNNDTNAAKPNGNANPKDDAVTTTNNSNSNNNNHNNLNSNYIPLSELIRADEKVTCDDARLFPAPIVIEPEEEEEITASNKASHNNEQQTPAPIVVAEVPDDDDIVVSNTNLKNDDNKPNKRPRPNSDYLIPRILHMTGEGKCLTKPFWDNAKAWSFEGAGWTFAFHDKAAKKRLVTKHWPEFPHLQNAIRCLENAGGAALSDLWRYLVLWEYGGVYTDMDNGPGNGLNATTVNTVFAYDIDAWFLQDKAVSPNFPSQHFFAVSPKHPMMYFAVQDVINGMMNLQEVGTFYVPDVTGPSALDRAFLQFMQVPREEYIGNKQLWLRHPMSKPSKGTYRGSMNRTVTIFANSESERHYIRSSVINGNVKREGWKLMGMNDYRHMNKIPQNKTCLQLILEQQTQERQQQQQQAQEMETTTSQQEAGDANNKKKKAQLRARVAQKAKSWNTIQNEIGYNIGNTRPLGPSDYLGCYGDDRGARAMQARQEGSDFRISDCRLQCSKRGFPFAGMQNGNECYCGKSYNYYGSRPDNECNMDCVLGEGKCGGVFRLSVYKSSGNA